MAIENRFASEGYVEDKVEELNIGLDSKMDKDMESLNIGNATISYDEERNALAISFS